MIERTAVMAFKDSTGEKFNLSIKNVKADVADLDITNLMDNIISKKLIRPGAGDLIEKVSAQVVIKETTKVTL